MYRHIGRYRPSKHKQCYPETYTSSALCLFPVAKDAQFVQKKLVFKVSIRERKCADATGTVLAPGTLKTRDWKTQDWKTWDQIAGVEKAGLEKTGPNRRGGKGRTGKRGNIMCMGSEM